MNVNEYPPPPSVIPLMIIHHLIKSNWSYHVVLFCFKFSWVSGAKLPCNRRNESNRYEEKPEILKLKAAHKLYIGQMWCWWSSLYQRWWLVLDYPLLSLPLSPPCLCLLPDYFGVLTFSKEQPSLTPSKPPPSYIYIRHNYPWGC